MKIPAVSMLFVPALALAGSPSLGDDARGDTTWAEETPAAASSSDGPPGFRFGLSAAGGLAHFTEDDGFSGPVALVDLRLGAQISDRFALYAQPSLWLGSAGDVSFGTLGGTAMAELAIADNAFVAAGAGYGVLGSSQADDALSGVMLEARVGFYPAVSVGLPGQLRHRLMLGLDLRSLSYGEGTALLVTGCVGYELF